MKECCNQIIKLFTTAFSLGFKIAAPVTVTILVTDISVGDCLKSMPQLNVFMLGMPIKIILAHNNLHYNRCLQGNCQCYNSGYL